MKLFFVEMISSRFFKIYYGVKFEWYERNSDQMVKKNCINVLCNWKYNLNFVKYFFRNLWRFDLCLNQV